MPKNLKALTFEGGFDEKSQFEAKIRGYRSHIWAEFIDGSRCRITFYDIVRLGQSLEDERSAGRTFFTEKNLIVLSEVTLKNMESAAIKLADDGFFDD